MENNKILVTEQILLDIDEGSQKAVFAKIASLAKELNFIKKEKKLIKAFQKRERESSTGFGDGFCIPHARNNDIMKPGIFFLRLKNGIEWKALDEKPVNVVIALIVPQDKAADAHLELLSKVAQKIIKPELQKILLNSKDKKEIIKELTS